MLVVIVLILLPGKIFPYVRVTPNILPSRERRYSLVPIYNFTVHLISFNTFKCHVEALTCQN